MDCVATSCSLLYLNGMSVAGDQAVLCDGLLNRCQGSNVALQFLEDGQRREVLDDSSVERDSYLVSIYAIVDRPGCLEVLQHALFELLGQMVDTDEVLQVFHACVVEGTA